MGRRLTKHQIIRISLIGAIILGLVIMAFLFYKAFNVTGYEVTGNSHYSDEEIYNLVVTDKLCENTLFLSMKYKNKSIHNIPFVERIDVSVKDNHFVVITVYEKALAGYVECLGNYMYFDKDGIVVESSKEATPGVPEVTGLSFDYIVLHEKLPVEDESIFRRILNITQSLEKAELQTDRIYFNTSNQVILYFGQVRVNVGDESNFEEKIAIIAKNISKIEGKKGEVHLENFTTMGESFSFIED